MYISAYITLDVHVTAVGLNMTSVIFTYVQILHLCYSVCICRWLRFMLPWPIGSYLVPCTLCELL